MNDPIVLRDFLFYELRFYVLYNMHILHDDEHFQKLIKNKKDFITNLSKDDRFNIYRTDELVDYWESIKRHYK